MFYCTLAGEVSKFIYLLNKNVLCKECDRMHAPQALGCTGADADCVLPSGESYLALTPGHHSHSKFE